MWCLLCATILASLPAQLRGQVPPMAMAMAGEVASVVADKVERKVEQEMKKNEEVQPCFGPQCCEQSSCLNVPGLGCSRSRGLTKCVGAISLPMRKGTCACVHGSCTSGKCPAPPATVGAVRGAGAGGEGAAVQQAGSAYDDTPDSDFLTWHTPSRLFAVASDRSTQEGMLQWSRASAALSLLSVAAALGLLATGMVFLWRRSQRELEEDPEVRILGSDSEDSPVSFGR